MEEKNRCLKQHFKTSKSKYNFKENKIFVILFLTKISNFMYNYMFWAIRIECFTSIYTRATHAHGILKV